MFIKGNLAHISFWKKCLFVFFISFIGLVISISLSLFLKINETDIYSIRLNQLVFGFTALALPAIISAILFNIEPQKQLSVEKYPSKQFIVSTILVMFLSIPLINILSSLNQQIHFPQPEIEAFLQNAEKMANDLTIKLLSGERTSDLIANLIILALIPAVTEELFFRGMLQNLLKEKVSVHVAIWISAIIFSAFHMQFYGFIPRMLLGGLLGYFLLWSESLILPIIAHFTNNAIMIIAYFFIQKNHLPINMDNLGTNQQQWVGLFSLVPLFATLYFMHLKYLSMKKNYNHKEL